jgi:hypothetical protein
VKARGTAASATGLYIRMNWRSSYPTSGDYVSSAQRSGVVDLVAANGPIPAAWTVYEFVWTAPATAQWCSFSVYNYSGSGATPVDLFFDDAYVIRQLLTGEIKAAAITPTKLSPALLDLNLVANPSAETGTTDAWAFCEGTALPLTADATDRQHGDYSFKIAGNGVNVSSYLCRAFPVFPGETYYVRARVRGSAAAATGLYIRIHVRASYPAGDYVTTALHSTSVDLTSNQPVNAAWTLYEGFVTIPAGAYWASLSVYKWTGTEAIDLYFDDVCMLRQVPSALLKNSAVTYAKIQNVSVTDRLLGRQTAGAGVVEEIPCTAAGRALIAGASAAAQRTTLSISDPPGKAVTSVSLYSGGTRLFTNAAAQMSNGNVTLTPLAECWALYWWPFGFTPSLIGIDVTTAVAAALGKLAVHLVNADMSIGTQLGVTGSLDFSTTGIKSASIAPGASWAGPGFYWVGWLSDSAVVVRQVSTNGNPNGIMPYRSAGQGVGSIQRTVTDVPSGFPATPPALSVLAPAAAAPPQAAVLLGAP